MTIKNLIDTYQIDVQTLSKCICLSINTLRNNATKMDTLKLTVSQLVSIHKTFNIPFNQILGDKVFTPQNIDTQKVTDNLAFSDKELAALKSLINKELQKDALV